MDEKEIALVESSVRTLGVRTEAFIGRFYEHFFSENPELLEMFSGSDMSSQRRKMVLQIIMIVDGLRNPDYLRRSIHELAYTHKHSYHVRREHYQMMIESMLAILPEFLEETWSSDHDAAWRNAFAQATEMMLNTR